MSLASDMISGLAGLSGAAIVATTVMLTSGPRPGPEYIDSLAVRIQPSSAPAGTLMQACSFPVFHNGAVGLVASDSVRCFKMYTDSFTAVQRSLNKKQKTTLAMAPSLWP